MDRQANPADRSKMTHLGSRECIATTTARAEFFRETVEKLLS
jgi:ribosomal protein L17